MKYSSILLVVFFAFFTSCTSENEVLSDFTENEASIDFSGVYVGKLDCTGEMSDAQGESVNIIITKSESVDSYFVNMGDDVVFTAFQIDNVLTVGEQIINENQEFDIVSIVGEIRMLENEMIFEFTHNVDNEGESICSFPLIKK